MKIRSKTVFLPVLLVFCVSAFAASDAPPSWPLKLTGKNGVATVYQPQLETVSDNRLTARAAVSVLMTGEKEPRFGAVWMVGRLITDREAGTATVTSVEVTDVKAPGASPDNFEAFKKFLSEQLTAKVIVIPLSQLKTGMEDLGKASGDKPALSTTPPEILFRETPAKLLIVDGEPKTQPIEDGKLLQVVNTAEVLVKDPATSFFFIWTEKGWVGAADLKGPWSWSEAVPPAVEALGKKVAAEGEGAKTKKRGEPPPEIILRGAPAELFVTKGAPQYEPLAKTALLHVTNTAQDILRDIKSQDIYIVASGRWFKAQTTAGPWTFVASDKLPEDFSRIPPKSPRAGVRVFVAGTPEAKDAVLDAHVPQTAAVKRGPADVKVEYDGSPKWKNVEGMEKKEVAYAENTPDAIFKVKNHFYLCREAVWYEAAQPEGPWSVAAIVPTELNHLPPSCPHYQCSYVNVYEATPDTVYCGYTAGYTGCYAFGATIMFGTGFYYPPYYGSYYYPRPVTYGYHAYYNPSSGWGAVGYRGPNGGIAVSGPVGGWGQPGRPGGIGGPSGEGGIGGPGRPGDGRPQPKGGAGTNANIYNRSNRSGAAVQPSPRPATGGSNAGARPSKGMSNNVYADPSGNVHRQNSQGSWESRSGNSWSSSSQNSNYKSNQSDLNRQSQVRQSSSYGGGSYSGGGSRGGYSGGGSRGGGGGGRGGGGRR